MPGSPITSSIDPWFLNLANQPVECRAFGVQPWARAVGSHVVPEGGIIPSSGLGGLFVASTGTNGAPAVTIGGGCCVIPDGTQYGFVALWPTGGSITLDTPHATLPRMDRIIAEAVSVSEFADAATGARLRVLPGTANATPANGLQALPARAISIARATVPANGASATTIADDRVFTRPVGVPRVAYNDGGRAGSHDADLRIDHTTLDLDGYISAAWRRMLTGGAWSTWTPTFSATGGSLAVGSTGSANGYYATFGKLAVVHVAVVINGSGVQGRTDGITMSLWGGATLASGRGNQRLAGEVFHPSPSAFFPLRASAAAGGTTLSLFAVTSASDCAMRSFRNADGTAAAGTGRPQFSAIYTWTAGVSLELSGVLELA